MVPVTQIKLHPMDYMLLNSSQRHKLQNNTTIDGQFISAGELVVKSQYL